MGLYAADAIKFLPLALTANADVLALVADKKIRVLALFGVFTAGAGTLKFQTGGATDLTGAMSGVAEKSLVMPFNEYGWFETAVGAKLNAVIATTAFNGGLVYVLV